MSGEEKKPVFLNAKQVAERYGVSKQWPYHDPDMQKLRIRIGRRVLWRLEDLEAFEESSKDWMSRPWVMEHFRKQELERKRKLLKFDIA